MRSRLLRLALTLAALIAVAPTLAWAQSSPFPVVSNVKLQNAATATGVGVAMSTSKLAIVTLQTSGTFTGTVTYQMSNDGTNWSTLTCYTIGGSTGVTTATAAAVVRCNVTGIAQIRANITSFTPASGTITVVANGTSFGFPFAATTN